MIAHNLVTNDVAGHEMRRHVWDRHVSGDDIIGNGYDRLGRIYMVWATKYWEPGRAMRDGSIWALRTDYGGGSRYGRMLDEMNVMGRLMRRDEMRSMWVRHNLARGHVMWTGVTVRVNRYERVDDVLNK